MFDGIPLLDAIANSASPLNGGQAQADLLVRVANELVAAVLDQHRHVEALDECGPTKEWRRLYVRETEAPMRQLHEEWLSPARGLLARMREMRKAGHRIERLEELEDAVGLTRALLMTTVDDIERGREQARNGESFTLEEVRRELHAATGR